jgi:pyrimidine-nucleoside phosphorylase
MSLFMPEIIRRKRNGQTISTDEIRSIIEDYTAGKVPDYQISALLMAIYFQGLDGDELHAWTEAMLHSGKIMDLEAVTGTVVDKHSTGGVGDKISLCLAPAVASLGVPVPMISGRGLGHTGGTLDKLESIPGFQINLPMHVAGQQLARLGLFLIGQTDDLAPADRKLYALRDVTATVESIPLIASSIMSKKLAEGIDALVLDVKVGTGAFMPDIDRARDLARTMIAIGKGAAKQVRAVLTSMDSPIGFTVGNALEMKEAIDVMRGEGPDDTTALTKTLGAEMLVIGGRAKTIDDGRKEIGAALEDGRALERFAQVIEAQGGDPSVCDNASILPQAKGRTEVTAPGTGYLSKIDPRKVAQAALEVGAGRRRKEDAVDPATGVVLSAKVGDSISKGDRLAELHHNHTGHEIAQGLLESAFEITDDPPEKTALIIETI